MINVCAIIYNRNFIKEDKTMKKLLAKITVFASVMAMAVGISAVVASAAVYKLTDAMEGQVVTSDISLGTSDYFTVVTGHNTISIVPNEKYYIYDQAAGTTTHIENAADAFHMRLKTNGDGDKTRRAISFTTATDNAELTVYAVNGSGAASNAGRSMTVEGPASFKKTGVCLGSTTESYNGSSVAVVRKETIPLAAAGTYYIYSPKGSFSIYDLQVKDGDGAAKFWAPSDAITSSVTTAYPDPIGAVTQITLGNSVVNGVNHNGDTSNNARIRLGLDAYDSTSPVTIASCGFITFDYADVDGYGRFAVDVRAASSGATTSREVFIGTYSDEGVFEDIDSGFAVGNSGTDIVFDIPCADSETKTYAIYVKPYDKDEDGVIEAPAENTDIMSIQLVGDGDYYTTPTITLDNPEIRGGELIVTGHFNNFSGEAFDVSKIWISATSEADTEEEATWKGTEDGPNSIIYLIDDQDGTASFEAVFTDGNNAIIPDKSVKLQAHAIYGLPDEVTNPDVTNIPNTVISSNAVKFIP